MADFPLDQAQGLRRLLAGGRPRILSVLSATPRNEKTALLLNLSASLARAGSNVLLLDACSSGRSLAQRLQADSGISLMQALRQSHVLDELLRPMADGFALATLSHNRGSDAAALPAFATTLDASGHARLNALFGQLAAKHDVLLVDAELDSSDVLPMHAMAAGEILIQVGDSDAAITNAYGLIKRLHGRLGKRSYDILVTGSSVHRAGMVYRNMARAASQYLALDLRYLGCIPEDEQLLRANRLGRCVIDAFPMAAAAVAFRSIAGQFVAESPALQGA